MGSQKCGPYLTSFPICSTVFYIQKEHIAIGRCGRNQVKWRMRWRQVFVHFCKRDTSYSRTVWNGLPCDEVDWKTEIQNKMPTPSLEQERPGAEATPNPKRRLSHESSVVVYFTFFLLAEEVSFSEEESLEENCSLNCSCYILEITV